MLPPNSLTSIHIWWLRSAVSCTAFCPLIHLKTWLLIPQPWSHSSLIPSIIATGFLAAIPLALTVQGFPSPFPVWALQGQCVAQRAYSWCMQAESFRMAVWSCSSSVIHTPLSCLGKCSIRDSHMTLEHLSLFLQNRSPFSCCTSLPPLSFAGRVFCLLSLSFALWLPTAPCLLGVGSWLGWCALKTCFGLWALLWLKGSFKFTALHGVCLLWVHQRSIGKLKSTTIGKHPCQLGHFAGMHEKL